MIVIIDGLDCSGKSTVYNMLYEREKGTYFIKESYPGPSDAERLDRLRSFCRRAQEPYLYVYDRATVIDDVIYEYRFNKRQSILEDKLSHELFEHVFVFHFTVEKEEWLKRMARRGDKYIDPSEYDSIVEAYDKYYSKYNINRGVIDTTDIDPEKAYDQVMTVFGELQSMVRFPEAFGLREFTKEDINNGL